MTMQNMLQFSFHHISKIILTNSILIPQPPSIKMTPSAVGTARATLPKQIPKTTITRILLFINILCANMELKFVTVFFPQFTLDDAIKMDYSLIKQLPPSCVRCSFHCKILGRDADRGWSRKDSLAW